MKRLYLIDAYALIFRYYYAFLGREMRNSEGFNTSVLFGFVKFVRELIKRENPDLIGVAFDPAGGSFRRRLYPEYKANRSATPEDIILSVPEVKRWVEAMCIPILEVADFEADDVIGTLAVKGEEAGYEVFMVTPDKDYGQLVSEKRKLYRQKSEGIEITDLAAIKAKYGIDDPQLVRDILAIWGDASDNIPGVYGIGEKGACKLVGEWGTIENILENIDKIKGKQAEKIAASTDILRLSKRLTTIALDVPIEFDEQALTRCEPNVDVLREIYKQMNFRQFLGDLPAEKTPVIAPKNTPKSAVSQGLDLFSALNENVEADNEEAEEAVSAQVDSVHNVEHTYTYIDSAEKLQELVAQLADCEEFAFDTETSGLNPLQDSIVGISFAKTAHEAWYVPMNKANTTEYAEILRPLFANYKIAKIGQNIKFDLLVLRQIGIEVEGRLIDTMILDYLLDSEARHNMNALALKYLNYQPIEIESLIGKGRKQLSMAQVAAEKICEYAAEDADIALRLKQVLYSKIEQEPKLLQLYDQIEEPLIRVLADMESAGVKIDINALISYGEQLTSTLLELSERIRGEANDPDLNINSSTQLGELLFGKMKIAEKPKLTKTKKFSTEEEYLQTFAGKFPIVDDILEYRGLKKLLSTYVEALPQLINPRTGRIHTTYNQAVTATGRLSSTNPNLQNIPIRDEIGRPIRAAFIPTDEGHTIISADYSQVELRIMAHLSEDEHLISAFEDGEDIHAATAARLFHKSIEEVTSDDRRKAKTANFGIIYGISAFGLSQRLDIPRSEAKEIIDGYFESYPQVKIYMDKVVEQTRESGFVQTIFGRRRYLGDINSRNASVRNFAERNAINAPIQGSAADIMKIAMIGIANALKSEGLQSRMIMQVHDEVVIDALISEQQQVEKIVVEQMEAAANLKVRLLAECGAGSSWLEAH